MQAVHHPLDPQHLPIRVAGSTGISISHDLRPVYTAASEAEAKLRFERVRRENGASPYPAISRLWTNAWTELVPFLDYVVRSAASSADPTRSNRSTPATAAPSEPAPTFPMPQAALKCLYLVTRSLDPTGKGRARWATRWKPALNAFAITFEGRIIPAGN